MATAYEIPGFTVTVEASADLKDKQFHGVVMEKGKQLAVAKKTVAILGVLQNKPDAQGRPATVMTNGVSKVVAGAAFDAGVELEVDDNGEFIALNAGKAVAMALDTSGGANDIVPALLYK